MVYGELEQYYKNEVLKHSRRGKKESAKSYLNRLSLKYEKKKNSGLF